MGEINHFSHKEHPLKLIENWKTVFGEKDDDRKEVAVVCQGCQEPISVSPGGGFAYGCIPCRYFLHKTCAELRPTINHHIHPFHPLTLLSVPFDSWECDVCRKKDLVRGFSYQCSECNFDACINCGVEVPPKEETLIKLKHEGHHPHEHTLTLQSRSRSATFRCDACHSVKKDLLYTCDSCDFWIHKTCASLAKTINLPHHHHPLVLIYSLPDNFYNFSYDCEFCKVCIRKNVWLYHCANCRYFAHIDCALNQELHSRDGLVAEEEKEEEKEEEVKDLLHFPMSEAFTDPLKLLHSGHQNIAHGTSQDDDEATSTEIHGHWSHDHPLILNYVESPLGHNNGNMNSNSAGSSDLIEVCYVCVRPLSLPYYSCSQDGCSFSLHKYCSQLPLTLQKHQLHPHHVLHLVNTSKDRKFYRCTGCFSWGNTFVYKCSTETTCKFYLNVNCAFLPNTIKHESHNHPLTQVTDPKVLLCKACDRWSWGISYACKDNCRDFQLCLFCALRSPRSLSHRFCKGHEIPLTYPPVENHPEDFYCEICENEMHPKFPLYYCNKKCKNSFHLYCLSPIDFYANIWREGTRSFSYHRHPLTYVRRNKSSPKYVCSTCNRDINGLLILECRALVCNFNICFDCHYDKI